jgi:hypothetical protein
MMFFIDKKIPGHVSSKPRASDTCEGLGCTISPLLNNGELVAKLVGKGGSTRQRINRSCGTYTEFLGGHAWTVGTLEERQRTAAVLEALQTSENSEIKEVPKALEDACTRIEIPADAERLLIGQKRMTLNELEDECGVLTFWVPSVASTSDESKDKEKPALKLEKGMLLEGRYEGKARWFEVKVLEVTEKDNEPAAKVQWTYDDEENTSVLKASEMREPGSKDADKPAEPPRTLGVFGQEHLRTDAKLRCMALVVTKCPDAYAKELETESPDGEGFGVMKLKLDQKDADRLRAGSDSRSTFTPPARLKSIAAAARCVLVLVGNTICSAGTAAARKRGRDYAKWLSMEAPYAEDEEEREDVKSFPVPVAKVPNLPEEVILTVEKDTGCFIMFDDGAARLGLEGEKRLLICGSDAKNRAAAFAKLQTLQNQKPPEKLPEWGSDSRGNTWKRPSAEKSDSWSSWKEPEKEKPKVIFVVDSAEEERRKKRAARFA